MEKIEITKTELVWPGKYNEDGTRKEVERVNLPFQVIETINETRATREAAKKPKQKSLFDVLQAKEGDTFQEGWKNKLIWGDNLLVMGSLLEKFAGKIDLLLGSDDKLELLDFKSQPRPLEAKRQRSITVQVICNKARNISKRDLKLVLIKNDLLLRRSL